MSKTNYTRALRRAQEQGARIVCSVAPFSEVPVKYMPRFKEDPHPWVLDRLPRPVLEYRYSGRECRAVTTR